MSTSTRPHMETLLVAAAEASRLYENSFRRGNICRAQNRLRDKYLSKQLVNFYLDEIEWEIAFIFGDEEKRGAD